MILFAKLWFLNETIYPLSLKIEEDQFTYDDITIRPCLKQEIDEERQSRENSKDSNLIDFEVDKLETQVYSLGASHFSKKMLEKLIKNGSHFLQTFTGQLDESSERKMWLKLKDSKKWSDQNFSEQTIGDDLYLDFEEEQDLGRSSQNHNQRSEILHEFSLKVINLPGKLSRTKLIFFSPKFFFINKTNDDLLLRFQHSNPQMGVNREYFTLRKARATTLFARLFENDKIAEIKFSDRNYMWSGRFKINDIGTQPLKIRNAATNSWRIVIISVGANL
jgi:hypothetical protein